MNRVLLLATTIGYQTRTFGEAAERLGVRLVFATDRCDQLDDPWWDGAIAIRFHDEPRSVEAVLQSVAERSIDGILAVGDRPTVIAAEVAARIGLPWHTPGGARVARDKRLSRERLRAAGLRTPWFTHVPSTCDARALAREVRWPVVVKPTTLSGSRGVIRADDEVAFVAAFDRVRGLLQSPDVRALQDEAADRVLIEAFIPGHEYAIEGVMEHGRFRTLAIFDKPDPLDGPFFEESLYVTPTHAGTTVEAAIDEATAHAAAAIGLAHGPVHAECRVGPSGITIVEVAARPIGGLCARALRFTDGRGSSAGLEELLLRQAVGESTEAWRREARASGVLMIPIPTGGVYRGVSGVDEALRVHGVREIQITAKVDQRLVPLPEGASYLGFIFAGGPTPGDVEASLREAHAHLVFQVDREIPLVHGAAS